MHGQQNIKKKSSICFCTEVMDFAKCTVPVSVHLNLVISRMTGNKIIVIVNYSCNKMGRETDSNSQVLYVLPYWIRGLR